MRAVYDPVLELTVVFHPESGLPHAVRSREDHPLLGPSTLDWIFSNYALVGGVLFPHRFKRIYNNEHALLDFMADDVLINPEFAPGFFDGPEARDASHAPRKDSNYTSGEIGEYLWNNLWTGPFLGTFGNLSAVQPFEDLPGLWWLEIQDAPVYKQVVLEFEDAIIVLDGPPHQSHLVLQWVRERFGRSVTHIWVSQRPITPLPKGNSLHDGKCSPHTTTTTMPWESRTT